MTTASCLVAGTTTLIIAGAFDLSRFETQQQRRTVSSSSYRIHAQFNSQTHQNDIATIILPTDLVFNQFVGAISLASGADQFIGRTAVISGFGTLIEPGPLSNHIQFTTRAIVTNPVCYSLFGIIGSSYICTAADFNRASCYGDAGGPLTVLEGGSTLQIGIMSIGCDVGRPGGYTRVSYYINWIHLHMV